MQKQFTVNARAPNDNTCVSRASTNQHLTKDVASVQIGSAKMVGDTRGWQQQGARVTGLLRIDRNLVSAILRTSGKRLSTTDGSSSLYDTMTNCLLPLRSCLSQPGLKTKAKVWNKAQQMQKFRLQKLTWA